jgi:hypothetical protein
MVAARFTRSGIGDSTRRIEPMICEAARLWGRTTATYPAKDKYGPMLSIKALRCPPNGDSVP